MIRFRHLQLDMSRPVVTTHCTIDTGDGTFQTAITFRCSEGFADVVAVARPYPHSVVAEHDRTSVSRLFGGVA
ncbi:MULTISPECIES: hypothetical protein [unclassified Marinobacter]|uniref:hypothetical protein n=1 Tax=unclassified Marinobacter TaxID=83889 RepID=UPI001925186D|nr:MULTISPECIES: hypothetical protein [unclassified Marinobacter]MBL3825134.1 hypothetical protein [Marinobacter sp. MC3]MBL3893662.1 hypothetical protein [Marinobacter sp. MW3]